MRRCQPRDTGHAGQQLRQIPSQHALQTTGVTLILSLQSGDWRMCGKGEAEVDF